MNCKRYSKWISEAAAGSIKSRTDVELHRHLVRCENCRLALERERSLLAAIDKTLMQTLAAEPSPQMLGRIHESIATGPFKRRMQNPLPWRLRIATGCVALLVAGLVVWSIRQHSSARRVLPPNSASVAEKSVPPKLSLPAASGRGKHSGLLALNSGLPRRRHEIARTKREHQRREQPYVLVEKDEPALVQEFYNQLAASRSKAAPLLETPLVLKRLEEQRLVITPLELKPITIAALDPGESHEQHLQGERRQPVE